MRFRTVFFDLDGTLIDHFAAIHRSYSHTLPQFGLPAPTMEEVRAAVGGGLDQAMLHFVTPEQVPDAVRLYRAYFETTMLDDVVLNPGAMELLSWLKEQGTVCAVLTNKLGSASRRICEHLGLMPWLQGVFGAKDTPWVKPDPAFTNYALAELSRDAATALLVGDSPFDVQTGIQGGFPCWCVTTGTHNEAELRAAGATTVFPGLPDLMAALMREKDL